MEDITLKGVKVIRYNSERTDEIIRLSPPHAGDTWHLPKWWELKANNQLYLDCTVLEIGGNHLVIPTQMQSELRIVWDGTDISFPYWRNIERAALFAPGLYGAANVITDYIFPSIGVRGSKVAAKFGGGSGAAMQRELNKAFEDKLRCKVVCADQACEDACDDAYNQQVQAIYDKYGQTNPNALSFSAPEETGPKAISGYYPLYDLEASANALVTAHPTATSLMVIITCPTASPSTTVITAPAALLVVGIDQ